jgi:VPDSG-CTERM motif
MFVLTDTDFNTESLTISLANSPVGTINSFFGATVLTSSLGNSALSDLSTDGKLSLTISGVLGNEYLTSATLLANGGPGVPEGGATLTLLGLALLGMLAARRKFVSVN